MSHWHTLSHKKLAEELLTSLEAGLASERIAELRRIHGENTLPAEKTDSLVRIFIRQFQSPLIYVLFASALILLGLNEFSDAAIILFVLLFNATIGSLQEGRAQNTLRALKTFIQTNTTVIRDGKEMIISDTELVPGDVILVQEGEKIPADARTISVHGLRVNEAALTGESLPVDKTEEVLRQNDMPLTSRVNMLYKGTSVASGDARAVVVATGIHTEIGKISTKIVSIESEIPLKREIAEFSQLILLIVGAICGVLFLIGMLAGNSLVGMFGMVISLAVSIIPEGLPIVMTLVLANGVWRMAKQNAVIKKLQAVEALGQAHVIAVDKTGTITKNEMVVRSMYTNNRVFSVSGDGYAPQGGVTCDGKPVSIKSEDLELINRIATLTANAHVALEEGGVQWRVTGDPTEAAMVVLSAKLGIPRDDIQKAHPRIAELPFHYKNKYHATLHRSGKTQLLAVAGAPEVLIGLSSHIVEGSRKVFSPKHKEEIKKSIGEASARGLRVIGFAMSQGISSAVSALEESHIANLAFVGFYCIEDSIRPEVPAAVAKAQSAGIRVVMMTGDSVTTAQAIAEQAGIFRPGDRMLTGGDIDELTPDQLAAALATTTVFARMTPDYKLKIVQGYKQRGDIVAMTGDGVNDAPALVAADLGISMGKIGTEVAKEASDIVLLDDNFASIVAAIEEGRNMYQSIKRVILYLSCNSIAAVLLIAVCMIIGLPLPLLPGQIIWLNLVTNSFLDISIGMEGRHGNMLQRKRAGRPILFDGLMFKRLFFMSLPTAFLCLPLFAFYVDGDMAKAYSMVLTTIAISQWFNAWNCRSEHSSVFNRYFFSNRYLLAALGIVSTLQILLLYTPFLQKIFHTTGLTLVEWLICTALGSVVMITEEGRKAFVRMRTKEPSKGASLGTLAPQTILLKDQ